MKKTSKILIIGEIQNQHAAHVTVELLEKAGSWQILWMQN